MSEKKLTATNAVFCNNLIKCF